MSAPTNNSMIIPCVTVPFFVFDVESIGLHGEGFAVGGGVYLDGAALSEFRFACLPGAASGVKSDRDWVEKNCPYIEPTHHVPATVRAAFWTEWEKAKRRYPGICVAGECLWPVEANFVTECVAQDPDARRFEGPYPFHEIASYMAAAGMNPMAIYERQPSEQPAHDPLADARLSARLLAMAINKIQANNAALKAFQSRG